MATESDPNFLGDNCRHDNGCFNEGQNRCNALCAWFICGCKVSCDQKLSLMMVVNEVGSRWSTGIAPDCYGDGDETIVVQVAILYLR